jgi:hypothetical protein
LRHLQRFCWLLSERNESGSAAMLPISTVLWQPGQISGLQHFSLTVAESSLITPKMPEQGADMPENAGETRFEWRKRRIPKSKACKCLGCL